MTRVSALIVLGLFASPLALSAAGESQVKKTSTTIPAAKRRTGSSLVRVAGKKGSARRKLPARHAVPAPSFQLHPDPERYQQIQQSLADRGYFKGAVNGVWGDDSVDAVRRFQIDRKLDPDGKINALTLSGLGLGARHTGPGSLTPAPAATSVPVQTTPTPVPTASDLPGGVPAPPRT